LVFKPDGVRRLRAAKLAELESLASAQSSYKDAEAFEVHCVENLQREDSHPLEDVLGF
jgi:ParB-like chromosome segregation protein Spo0J